MLKKLNTTNETITRGGRVKYTICLDTICTGFSPIIDGDGRPVEYETEALAQAELDSDPEFYDECFVCRMDEIGYKTIFYGEHSAQSRALS